MILKASTIKRRYFKHCLFQQTALLGANHVSTLHTLNNLGSSYEQQDRFSEAMVLYKECFEKRKIVLGCSHPETVRTMTNIARINILQNNYSDEAMILRRQRKMILSNLEKNTLEKK